MQDRQYENTEPVFRLKPVFRSNVCEVKLVGYMDSEHKLGDEVMEFQTSPDIESVYGKNVDFIESVKNYNITAGIYKNNIIGNYLISHTFLPVYSISFAYTKTLVSGFLFDIFIGFELDEESKKLAEEPRKCTNARLYGKFVLKLFCDDELIENFDSILDSIDDKLIQEPEVLSKMESMSEDEFIAYLDTELTKRKQYLTDLKNGIEITELASLGKTIDMLRNVYTKNSLNALYYAALNIREDERRKKYNAAESFNIPTKVLNIKDVENNSDYLDEYLGLK
jgi:hypothetical protein